MKLLFESFLQFHMMISHFTLSNRRKLVNQCVYVCVLCCMHLKVQTRVWAQTFTCSQNQYVCFLPSVRDMSTRSYVQYFTWVLRIWTLVLILAEQVFITNEPSLQPLMKILNLWKSTFFHRDSINLFLVSFVFNLQCASPAWGDILNTFSK